MPQKDSAEKAVRDYSNPKTARSWASAGTPAINSNSTSPKIGQRSRTALFATENTVGGKETASALREPPVRSCQPVRPKTTRTRGIFHRHLAPRAMGLCNRRLNGGGRSLSRIRLLAQIPDRQGKCPEFPSKSHRLRVQRWGLVTSSGL